MTVQRNESTCRSSGIVASLALACLPSQPSPGPGADNTLPQVLEVSSSPCCGDFDLAEYAPAMASDRIICTAKSWREVPAELPLDTFTFHDITALRRSHRGDALIALGTDGGGHSYLFAFVANAPNPASGAWSLHLAWVIEMAGMNALHRSVVATGNSLFLAPWLENSFQLVHLSEEGIPDAIEVCPGISHTVVSPVLQLNDFDVWTVAVEFGPRVVFELTMPRGTHAPWTTIDVRKATAPPATSYHPFAIDETRWSSATLYTHGGLHTSEETDLWLRSPQPRESVYHEVGAIENIALSYDVIVLHVKGIPHLIYNEEVETTYRIVSFLPLVPGDKPLADAPSLLPTRRLRIKSPFLEDTELLGVRLGSDELVPVLVGFDPPVFVRLARAGNDNSEVVVGSRGIALDEHEKITVPFVALDLDGDGIDEVVTMIEGALRPKLAILQLDGRVRSDRGVVRESLMARRWIVEL